MDKMSMSLDDIISMNKSSGQGQIGGETGGGGGGGGRHRGGGKMKRGRNSDGSGREGGSGGGNGDFGFAGAPRRSGGAGGGGADGYSTKAQDLAFRRLMRRRSQERQQQQGAMQQSRQYQPQQAQNLASNKILVSNLAESVSEEDVCELFSEFGQMRYYALHHDAQGKSLGTADIIFDNCQAAAASVRKYNGVTLDGRPLNIQIAVAEVNMPAGAGHVTSRLGTSASSSSFSNDGGGLGEGFISFGDSSSFVPRGNNNRSNSSEPGVSNKRAWKRDKSVPPSADQLDKEMEAYNRERQRRKDATAMEEG